MLVFLKVVIYLCLLAGVQGGEASWLPCKFHDGRELKKSDGVPEIEYTLREVILQFGKKGDAPVHSHAITFLVTGSRLNLQRYVEGVEPDKVECSLYRHRLQDARVRWPVQQANEYNHWFSCTIKHSDGDFLLTSYIRHTIDQPPSAQDVQQLAISDGEIVTVTAAMILKTQTPAVKSGLGEQKKLHCQFTIDHKGPNFSLEWHKQGERTTLFSHASHTGQTEGGGVDRKGLAGGDASYNLAFTKISNEGTYVCAVTVGPLSARLDVSLHIEVSPRVSLSVGPTLRLQGGELQKVVCEVERYYPLDVKMVWYKQDPAVAGQVAGSLLPTMIPNTLLSSHKHNSDRTLSLSSFFYITASLSDSGRQFTCKVSHKSLRVDIRKSFTLTVEEPSSWLFVCSMLLIIVILLGILCVTVPGLQARRNQAQKKPY